MKRQEVLNRYAARKALGWPVKRQLTSEQYARYRQAILTLGAWADGVASVRVRAAHAAVKNFRFTLLDRQHEADYSHAIVAALVAASALWLEVASHPASWVASW
jgi:hypothetical protein